MGDKVKVQPRIGTEEAFFVDKELAGQYAEARDANGNRLYRVGDVDAVVFDQNGELARVPNLSAEAMGRIQSVDGFVGTDQESYNLAAKVDQRRGEIAATDDPRTKFAAFARRPGLNTWFEGTDEDTKRFRATMKEELAGYGIAGDVAATIATFGAAGAWAGVGSLIGAGRLVGGGLGATLAGMGLGVVGGATEAALLEAQHQLDDNQRLAGEGIIGAAGMGGLFGGITAGALPAIAAVGRGARKLADKGPLGWAARKVFKHADDRAVTASRQREALEKALQKERQEIGGFTPEKMRRLGTNQARQEYVDRIRDLGGAVKYTADDMADAAKYLSDAKTSQRQVIKEWSSVQPKMRERVGDAQWRKQFEYREIVETPDGPEEVLKWGWPKDEWEIVEEEITARIAAMSRGGYTNEAQYLENFVTPKMRNAPGVMMGTFMRSYMKAGQDLLSGVGEAAAAKDVLKGLLTDADVWGRKAANINADVLDGIDDVLDGIGHLKQTRLADRFDQMPASQRLAYENADAIYEQLERSAVTLENANIFSRGTFDTLRKNLTSHRAVAQNAKKGADVAADMENARKMAIKLNEESMGKNTAPMVGAETAVAAMGTIAKGIDKMDAAAQYVGKALRNQKFQNTFAKTKTGVYAVRALNDKERDELYEDVQAMVEEYSTRPEALMERITQNTERMAMTDMRVANAMAESQVKQIQYFARHLPVTPQVGYGKRLPPSDSEVDSFLERVAAAQDYASVIASVADGSVSVEATETMRELAPGLYDRARSELSAIIEPIDMTEADDSILSALNIFMGELDPVYSPDFVLRLQDRSVQTQMQAQVQGQQQPKNPQALTSVPAFQNPQSGVTPGERLGSI